LSTDERLLFMETAATHRHLTAGDQAMLAAFAQASVKSRKLAKKPDTQAWERATRVMAMLATKLRLTPQATSDPQKLGRKRSPPTSYYDEMSDDDDN
jgi:phage terminase small subunit